MKFNDQSDSSDAKIHNHNNNKSHQSDNPMERQNDRRNRITALESYVKNIENEDKYSQNHSHVMQ